MEKRVAIIGAGIGGLLACKFAIAKGFRPTVFEAQTKIGGLRNHTLECTRLQNTKEDFQLSVTGEDYGLFPFIVFNSKVLGMDHGESHEAMQSWDLWGGTGKAFSSKGKWNIKVQHAKENSIKEYTAEFVILSIGRFSGLPYIPEHPQRHGPKVFDGRVLHSMDFSVMDNADAAKQIKG